MSRVAVVTGGASGMGEATCHELGRRGHQVAVLDVDHDAAQRVTDDLRAQGVTAMAAGADVTDRRAVEEAFGKIRAELGPVAVLVTSAGLFGYSSFADITVESWQRLIDVNLTGTFHCCQVAVGDMVAAGWGRIVMISSSSAQRGTPFAAHYAASRARSDVDEVAGPRVRRPRRDGEQHPAVGHRDADAARLAGGRAPAVQRADRRPHPGRASGHPADIAAAVGFLCSEEAGFITGQTLGVNGGSVM